VNLAVHFIRAKSSLILAYSSGWFPIYTPFSEGWGEEARYGGKRRGG